MPLQVQCRPTWGGVSRSQRNRVPLVVQGMRSPDRWNGNDDRPARPQLVVTCLVSQRSLGGSAADLTRFPIPGGSSRCGGVRDAP